MLRAILTAICIVLLQVQPVSAGDLLTKAEKAEKALDAGKSGAAIALMRSALIDAWKAAPLNIETAHFVDQPADGYGLYSVRSDAFFSGNEPLLIYLEPVGFTWLEENGIYKSHMAADFELMKPDGKILAGQEDFGEFRFASMAHNTEYMANLTLSITGAPTGQYILKVTLRDLFNNNQRASARMPFEIR